MQRIYHYESNHFFVAMSVFEYKRKAGSPKSAMLSCEEKGGKCDYQPKGDVLVCVNCGTEGDKIYSTGPERHSYDPEQKMRRTRTGPPQTGLYHEEMSTRIGDFGDSARLGIEERLRISKLRKWQYRVNMQSAHDRSLAAGLAEIERISQNRQKILREQASHYYRQALDHGIIRGRSVTIVARACEKVAARKLGIPLDTAELIVGTGFREKDVNRVYRDIVRGLEEKMPLAQNVNLITKICNKSELPPLIVIRATKIIDLAKEHHIYSGRGPEGTSAAAVYIATYRSGIRRTQKELAEIANVTEVTIRNRYKELNEKLGEELHQVFVD